MGIRELRIKYDSLFTEFFEKYPRKMGRQDAFDIFVELGEEGVDLSHVIKQAESYARNVDPREMQFVPWPKSWLKGRRWEDNDLFTDQRVSERDWFTGRWREGDAAAIYSRYGFVYPDPPIPNGVTDIAKFHFDARRTWIAQVANHILNGKDLPE